MNNLFKKLVNKETINYVIFGVLTTGINFISYKSCKVILGGEDTPLIVSISTIIAWVLSVLFAFITNKLFVFNSKDMKLNVVLKEFIAFVIARVFSGLCDLGWMVVSVSYFFMNDSIAKLLSNVFVVIMNYFFSKLFIFKKNNEE